MVFEILSNFLFFEWFTRQNVRFRKIGLPPEFCALSTHDRHWVRSLPKPAKQLSGSCIFLKDTVNPPFEKK